MTTDVESILYGERTLLPYEDERTGVRTEGWADLANESIRAMNHITSSPGSGGAIPAPTAYRVLGNLSALAEKLPQLFEQLRNGLAASLDVLDVYDTKQDPRLSVLEAGEQLQAAALHAQRLADVLGKAQTAIAWQGYNEPDDATADAVEGGE